MKTKIVIEIETEGFMPLMDGHWNEDETDWLEDEPQTEFFSEQQFHNKFEDIFERALDDDVVDRWFDFWPDQWNYLGDCCKILKISMNGKPMNFTRRK
jgi:hypothetical protein